MNDFTMQNKKKLTPIKELKEKLDEIFSEYIRKRDADKDGNCVCISCGKVSKWNKGMQNGHYISRGKLITRFDELNCSAQCVSCNIFKSGNYIEYRIGLRDKIGDKALEELEARRHQIKKLDRAFYKENIAYYKEEIKRLNKQKNFN